jgi:hypothetical protein
MLLLKLSCRQRVLEQVQQQPQQRKQHHQQQQQQQAQVRGLMNGHRLEGSRGSSSVVGAAGVAGAEAETAAATGSRQHMPVMRLNVVLLLQQLLRQMQQ